MERRRMMRTGTLNCSSPTCTARLTLGVILSPQAVMRRHGWALERQDGDPRPLPYCPRCREGTPIGVAV